MDVVEIPLDGFIFVVELFTLIAAVGLCLFIWGGSIGLWAHHWGRNFFLWALLSLITSPILAAIPLLIIGKTPKKIAEEQTTLRELIK